MDRQKKICSLTTVDITMEPFIITQMKYMMDRGWDVTVICNMKPSFIERLPKGVHYYNVPMERSFNLWVAIKSTFQLYRIFKKERFDIIQYAATHAALYSSFASWLCRIPKRIHLQWGIYNFSEMGLKGKFYKFVEWLTCCFSTDIRPVSHKNLLNWITAEDAEKLIRGDLGGYIRNFMPNLVMAVILILITLIK